MKIEVSRQQLVRKRVAVFALVANLRMVEERRDQSQSQLQHVSCLYVVINT